MLLTHFKTLLLFISLGVKTTDIKSVHQWMASSQVNKNREKKKKKKNKQTKKQANKQTKLIVKKSFGQDGKVPSLLQSHVQVSIPAFVSTSQEKQYCASDNIDYCQGGGQGG